MISRTSPVAPGVGLPWLTTARWATAFAQIGAGLMATLVLDVSVRWWIVGLVVAVTLASNVWWASRGSARGPGRLDLPAGLILVDVVGLAVVLLAAGGPLNPVSIYFLVLITQAAFVHGARIAALAAVVATVAYGTLFVSTAPELRAAMAMHPEVAQHFQGMFWAFAGTAALVTVFVTRLATAVAERDRDVRALEARLAESASLARLATLAADAAHELATPLGTIVLTASELERDLERTPPDLASVVADLRLISSEGRRCRGLLDDLAGRAGQAAGSALHTTTLDAVLADALAGLPAERRSRVDVAVPPGLDGYWPVEGLARAILNVVRNAFDASPDDGRVTIAGRAVGDRISLVVRDSGRGMRADEQARACEPFFTTKPGQGRGLGLFVVKQTLEMIGGRLDIRSVAGTGTEVEIVVPREFAS
ncbi:MAG: HAMP domain-containing histidine kinase [Acidobacteria bacterium]|nr:HAMP domain-containing histidine kinase [Acidobacteriota bacterium]